MSAKHRRPFVVFAAVAVICSMVLIAGAHRSKAEDSRAPRFHAGSVASPGAPISPLPGTPGSATPETVSGTDSSSGSPDAHDAGGAGDLEAPVGGTADGATDSDSGVVGLLPVWPTVPEVDGLPDTDGLPDPDEVSGTPEDNGKSSGAKARAGHGKDGKDGDRDDSDEPQDKGDQDDEDESNEDEVPVDGLPSQSVDPVDVPDGDG